MKQDRFDILVVGAGLGGVAAALRASAMGATVCLIEASNWIGGQYSAQGLTRGDEIEPIDRGVGCTASYLAFRRRAQRYYTDNFVLSDAGKALRPFEPGAVDANHGTNLRVAPRVAMETMAAMLAETRPAVTVLTGYRVTSVEMNGGRVVSLSARGFYGAPRRFVAAYVLDATDLGELLPLANVPFRLGAEARSEFGEPSAPPRPEPAWIQPITIPIAVELRPAHENHVIPKPPGYDEIAGEFVMNFDAAKVFGVVPFEDSLFNYRQFIAAKNFADPALAYDVTTLNDDNTDYRKQAYPTGEAARDGGTLIAARARSIAYAYWLQTACPRDDGQGHGYPNVRIATEVFDTYDGTAPQPYIRESRRMVTMTTVREQDVAVPGARARVFRDSAGIGFYHLDMHTLNGMSPYLGREAAHFQIPLGALIPKDVENLLPACKNLGVTHITNSAYRVHPIEWNVGESAGALAAFCIEHGVSPRTVPGTPALLRAFQHALLDAGVPLFWWDDVPYAPGSEVFRATQLVGIAGYMADPFSLGFGADHPVDADEQRTIERAAGVTLPASGMKRADIASWLVKKREL